jgi:hypothetical protein
MSRTISRVRIPLIQDNINIYKEIWGIGDCGGEEKVINALLQAKKTA